MNHRQSHAPHTQHSQQRQQQHQQQQQMQQQQQSRQRQPTGGHQQRVTQPSFSAFPTSTPVPLPPSAAHSANSTIQPSYRTPTHNVNRTTANQRNGRMSHNTNL